MSTYTELEARCKRRLGRRGMTITTEFLDEMIAAQEELEQLPTLPKWMKSLTAWITTPADDIILTSLPPADFIRVYDDQALQYLDEGGTEQRAIRLDTRNQLVSKRNAGIQEDIYWYLDELSATHSIEIAPTQTRDVDFRLSYYAKDTVLTGINTNNWCLKDPNQILGTAGEQIAVWLRDDRALKYYQGMFQKARGQMIRRIEADEWGDMDLVMGDPD